LRVSASSGGDVRGEGSAVRNIVEVGICEFPLLAEEMLGEKGPLLETYLRLEYPSFRF
jgi:hypothetical protein